MGLYKEKSKIKIRQSLKFAEINVKRNKKKL